MHPAHPSPFLDPGPVTKANSLAVLHLRRESLISTILREDDPHDPDSAADNVVNTRFGSFPHSTLLNQPWGAQILASKVDTGSRGRKPAGGKKRKRGEDGGGEDDGATPTAAGAAPSPKPIEAASSGFIHILPPTPETWSMSLPHRTQVVYTPDYSYILQRLRVRPGGVVIEAGAGSGSFTHAAARAVFNGYPPEQDGEEPVEELKFQRSQRQFGRVYSYEFHAPRAAQLGRELVEHGLDSIVRVTHRDVYQDGFNLPCQEADSLPAAAAAAGHRGDNDGAASPSAASKTSPRATAVFLDLPAPERALKHLTRTGTPSSPSPLHPRRTVHLCAFVPCIEQVQRAVAALRQFGWVEVSMAELAQRRLEVRRERVGLAEEGVRGGSAVAKDVDEAVQRLREVEARQKVYHDKQGKKKGETGADGEEGVEGEKVGKSGQKETAKQRRIAAKKDMQAERKLWKEGRVTHRPEQELKTHTSYLVFATMPVAWSEEDEKRMEEKYPVGKTEVDMGESSGSKKWKKAGKKAKAQVAVGAKKGSVDDQAGADEKNDVEMVD
ncbi:S-adenosyl-L-methionine-dependent methyltransferase [Lineolata rhizophorae]|uniref:tRNA (adenine(58)-N(1))-methyltransferase catalytic subunit TRM61 n=1 Tax=Lineolata rhizophorae TaxID=578093 RepID=A0A6A6NUV2_9PEZI|nr:S-adenosyl-L-methionine-dependent methyltransferase [Lineolata rhizophorae]